MEPNKKYKDTNEVGLIIVVILVVICMIMTTIEHNSTSEIMCLLIYSIYYVVHIEIQNNHNKLIDYLNDKIKKEDENRYK